jgi:putative endopeptidase
MVGDYFAAGMDEAAIERADVAPIRGLLDRIDAAQTSADILAVTAELQRLAGDPLHSLSVAPDFEDARSYLVYVGEGGLGLPEREYYLVARSVDGALSQNRHATGDCGGRIRRHGGRGGG